MKNKSSTTHDARRRQLLAAGVSVGAIAALRASPTLAASKYPSHPIDFVVPFAAGGGTDLVARPVAQGIGQALNESVIVMNKPGAAGIVGTQFVARAPADGYTVALGSTGTHTVNQSLYAHLPYDPIKDFEPVSMICYYNNVLVVRPDFPAKNFTDFVKLIKANPGKYVYGIGSIGSSGHLAMELLKRTAGLDIPGIPYNGASTALTDFIGGRVQILMDVLVNQAPLIKNGTSMPLAVTSKQRAKTLPSVPTVAESGYPGFEAIGWNGIFVPRKTPAAIIDTLNAAVRSSLKQPIMSKLEDDGLDIAASTPAVLGEYVKTESVKWAKLIKDANIKIN